ncbi:hypothetical protein C8F01DRAFT_1162020 [Mycena amicta]|nr:hypothetical protein C8F01DRAFT_1162020 [Mycena amicta]
MSRKAHSVRPQPGINATNHYHSGLKPTEATAYQREQEGAERTRQAGLSAAQKRAERAIVDLTEPDSLMDDDTDPYERNILNGTRRMDIGAGGEESLGEIGDDAREMYEELAQHHNKPYGRRRDRRNRQNRAKLVVDGFNAQMEAIADAHEACDLFFATHGADVDYERPSGSTVEKMSQIFVVDIWTAKYQSIEYLEGDQYIASTLVRQGMYPCSPYSPTVAITTRTLRWYHSQHLRCPRLGKQAFIRALCDYHTTPPRSYLQTQFAIAYDLYLRTLEIIRQRVATDLGRDDPDWRLKNACPCCLHKLKGEVELDPPMLLTMDGNNSLKRNERRERLVSGDNKTIPGELLESLDDRTPPRDYYIPREVVNEFGKDRVDDLLKGFVPDPKYNEEEDGCGDTWQNMKEQHTAKAWGLYEETGIFAAFCRHSICLVLCDMVRSVELSKYGLAVTAHLLKTLGCYLLGYDIDCKFLKWAFTHPLVGPLAEEYAFISIVGAFHGTGHHRSCQLGNLPLYLKGLGLEPLENAENIFSKSNTLAAITRHASRYHRQQEIVEYFAHADVFDVYANMSSLLVSKYKHTLEVLATLPDLKETMALLRVSSRDVFETWHSEEREQLKKLSREPPEETMQMEYYQKLVNLEAEEARVSAFMTADIVMMSVEDTDNYEADSSRTRRLETERRHAAERRDNTLLQVQDLERRLNLHPKDRWLPEGDAWRAAAVLVTERRYRRALDTLQKLVVSRLLELAKVNMAGTAKALQARSKALRNAITRYNAAAQALGRPILSWEEVVEYGFLADFDLLRLAREDIRDAAWAQPGARQAMDHHFKILRAEEERTRLNVEIRRLVTYMHEEKRFLVHHEQRLEAEGRPARAAQVCAYRMRQGRFSKVHMARFQKLSTVTGFTGNILPGVAVNEERKVPEGIPGFIPLTMQASGAVDLPPSALSTDTSSGEAEEAASAADGDGDDDTDEEDEEGLGDAMETLVRVTDEGEEEAEEGVGVS